MRAENERRHSLEKLEHFDNNLNGVHNIDSDDIIKANGLKIHFWNLLGRTTMTTRKEATGRIEWGNWSAQRALPCRQFVGTKFTTSTKQDATVSKEEKHIAWFADVPVIKMSNWIYSVSDQRNQCVRTWWQSLCQCSTLEQIELGTISVRCVDGYTLGVMRMAGECQHVAGVFRTSYSLFIFCFVFSNRTSFGASEINLFG